MTSRSNLFGLPPAQQRARAANADRRIRDYQTPAEPTVWPAPNLLPTLPGYVHGIVATDPLTIQCDGCGGLETPPIAVLTQTWFNPVSSDERRLCPDCRDRAGWPDTEENMR